MNSPTRMQFKRTHFDPAMAPGANTDEQGRVTVGEGAKPGDVYVYSDDIILAVNLAMATGRPLLLSGEPGSGKTTLAVNAARIMRRALYKETVTSQTRARDLLWRFDTLRRLNDAQTSVALRPDQYYVNPGTLWWAFDPQSAARRGIRRTVPDEFAARDPWTGNGSAEAFVLLDEIDKADPDVPNDLLEPFDNGTFKVLDTEDSIEKTRNVLLMLTTNGERELPPAFLRRCIALRLDDPSADWFVTIATRRYPKAATPQLFGEVADEVMRWREAAHGAGVRRPGTAEYLDALRACQELGITPSSSEWRSVALAVLWKNDKEAPAVGPS